MGTRNEPTAATKRGPHTPWEAVQAARGVDLLDRTRLVAKPNGEIVEVNRFDFNLYICTGGEKYIQVSDGSWIQARHLRRLSAAEQRVAS